MNNYKLKNKDVKHTDYRATILDVHKQTMDNFNKEYINLDKLKEDLTKDPNNSILEKKIYDIENKISETQYLLKAMPFMSKVKINNEENNEDNELSNFIKRKGSVLKGQMYIDYMSTCHNVLIDNNEIDNIDDPKWCYSCETEKVLDTTCAELCCPICGSTVHYQDSETNPEYSDNIQILSPFAYQRINHFKDFLSQLQAKNFLTVIPNEVLIGIQKELKKERITDVSDITPQRIKRYLKKLHLNKYYEHVNSLVCKFTGVMPNQLDIDTEITLIQMFKEIQIPFEKHCPKERKNFLSYSYTLHKMCQIIGRYDLLPNFPLLKSREKNYVQDCIWKGICNDLGWQYISSV